MEISMDHHQTEVKIPPPPSATDQKDLPPIDKQFKQIKKTDKTKLSTHQLICKTPQESPNGSVIVKQPSGCTKFMTPNRTVVLLGVLQFLFGILMVLFGVYVIAYKASLSHLGGGIWGGILAMITGISGILASAKHFCPFKNTAQKVAHTTFLALSLISVAVSQLIVVIASTGLARDINSVEFRESMERAENMTTFAKLTQELPQNYRGILFNAALILVSSLECLTAAVAAYRSSRELCPCFKRGEDYYQDNLNINRSHALVSSWLMEKHGSSTSAPQIYVVTGPTSTLGRGSKLSTTMMPVYAIPAPMMQQQVMGYHPALIPAPLGPVPSPIIPHPNRKLTKVYKHYRPTKSRSKTKSKSRSRDPTPQTPRSSRSKSKSKEPQITEQDVVRTYTGLDRAMAEEFIDICEMKNASSCSDTSCDNSTTCQSPCSTSSADGCHTNSDANSQDCLINK